MTEPRRAADAPPRNASVVWRWSARSAPWLVALAVYIVAAVAVTWPVAVEPADTVFGAPGDATGNITLLRYRNELGVGPLSNALTRQENAPFGVTLPGATSLPQIAIEGPMQVVGAITGSEVLAFNLAVLAGIVLSAFCCFLLCLHITGNPWAAGIAGIGYGFNPWILERAGGHVHFTHLWSLCLVVLGLILIREGRGLPAWILFGAATVIGLYTNTYFTLFIGVILAAFVIADLGVALVRRAGRAVATRRGLIAGAIFVVALIPQAIVSLSQRATIDGLLAGTRSPEDRLHYGARWWEWITPSDRHPIFDEWTAPYRLSNLHMSNAGETVIYVGVTVLALALTGLVTLVITRRRGGAGTWIGLFAVVMTLVAFITSLPSRVGVLGVDVPMPSEALAYVVEPWRVYARLFAVVALGVAILAAVGAAWLFTHLPRRAVPVAACCAAALVAFDLAARDTTFSAHEPPIYDLLAEQPGQAPRVEFPLVPPSSGRHLAYIFFTEAAGRPLMNGGRPGSVESALQAWMQDPSRRGVAPALAALGVEWAIVHGDTYTPGTGPVPGTGFELVGRSTTDSLWRVVAAPAPVIAAPTESFGGVEPGANGRSTQWMLARRGGVTLYNPGATPVDVTLRFSVASFARPRDFTIRFGTRALVRRRAGDVPTPVEIALTVPPGTSGLSVTTPTPPDSIAKVLGIPDARSVSLQFSDIQVSRTRPARA